MPNPIKEALLGRGWAGQTLSRSDTVERLNPLIKQHAELNHSYQSTIRTHDDPRIADVLQRLQKTARTDIGKLSETVLSCGGAPYNATQLDPEDFHLGGDGLEMLSQLNDLEAEFNDAIEHELDEVEHQMRTRGILEAVKSNSTDRLQALESLLRWAQGETA